MCHCTEYELVALQVRLSEENKLNTTTQQFITETISRCALKLGSTRGVVGWERVGTAFPHPILAWERVLTPFSTSNVTWRCGIQKITLKHGCDLTDGLATRRFALLVNSSHSETKRSSVEILEGEFLLYSNYLVQLFIWCGKTFCRMLIRPCFNLNKRYRQSCDSQGQWAYETRPSHRSPGSVNY